MHELSVAAHLLKILEEAVPPGARLTGVGVEIGELSGILPECLAFAFEAVTGGTPFEGATLKIEKVPASAGCRECRTRFRPEGSFICPACGSADTGIESGRELNIIYYELEEDEDGQGNHGQEDT